MGRTLKIGLGLAFVLGLMDIGFNFIPTGDGLSPPPLLVGVLGWATGLLTLGAVVWYWLRRAATAKWIIIVTRVVSALGGASAFFTGAPTSIQVLVAIKVALTVGSLVLLIRPEAERSAMAAGAQRGSSLPGT